MHLLSITVIVIVILLLVAGVFLRPADKSSKPQSNAHIYEAIPALLTPAERSFFGVLQQALASDYQIFAKVRLADLVRPVKNPSRSGWQSAFNRITGKHVDFVLCNFGSLQPVAVIELDDRSHERLERGVRDSLVDSTLADAGIPVLRIPARQTYSPAQIHEQVQNLFRSPTV